MILEVRDTMIIIIQLLLLVVVVVVLLRRGAGLAPGQLGDGDKQHI